MHAVILAGGSGTRLWPLSREEYPKQFLALNSDRSLFQETVARLTGLEQLSVVCREENRFLLAQQLLEIDRQAKIILEPEGKNTAAALALAAFSLLDEASNELPLMLVLPVDHVIEDDEAFNAAVSRSKSAAQKGAIVTFGVIPEYAHTGYGYLKCSSDLLTHPEEINTLLAFEEKPTTVRAEQLLQENETGKAHSWLWNCGIFLCRADVYLTQLARFAPQIHHSCQLAMRSAKRDYDFVRPDAVQFSKCPAVSIDYAVMEPLVLSEELAVVTTLNSVWSDIGSWSALWKLGKSDGAGNCVQGDVIIEKSENCYVRSEDRLVVAIGLQDLVIVDSGDALLVAARSHTQEVSRLVASLNSAGRSEGRLHRKIHRPWGSYHLLHSGVGFKVKYIVLNPGQSISLQRHRHRAEHWVLVAGEARVQKGALYFNLKVNQSTYIEAGELHRLQNMTSCIVELIEIQSGHNLVESDIERVDDEYGRD